MPAVAWDQIWLVVVVTWPPHTRACPLVGEVKAARRRMAIPDRSVALLIPDEIVPVCVLDAVKRLK